MISEGIKEALFEIYRRSIEAGYLRNVDVFHVLLNVPKEDREEALKLMKELATCWKEELEEDIKKGWEEYDKERLS